MKRLLFFFLNKVSILRIRTSELSNKERNVLRSVITINSLQIGLAGSVLISKWSLWFFQKLAEVLKKLILSPSTAEQNLRSKKSVHHAENLLNSTISN